MMPGEPEHANGLRPGAGETSPHSRSTQDEIRAWGFPLQVARTLHHFDSTAPSSKTDKTATCNMAIPPPAAACPVFHPANEPLISHPAQPAAASGATSKWSHGVD